MSEKALPVDPSQLSLFEEEHLTDEERAQLDREVEEAEKAITRTITVKAKPSRRPLDTTGLPEKVVHILCRRGPRRKRPPQGRICRDRHGRVFPSREKAGRGIHPQGCLP